MKRSAESQLTRESLSDEDSKGGDGPREFQKASQAELAKRVIKPLPNRRGRSESPVAQPGSKSSIPGSKLGTSFTAPALSETTGPTLDPKSLPSFPTGGFTFKPPAPPVTGGFSFPLATTTGTTKTTLPAFSALITPSATNTAPAASGSTTGFVFQFPTSATKEPTQPPTASSSASNGTKPSAPSFGLPPFNPSSASSTASLGPKPTNASNDTPPPAASAFGTAPTTAKPASTSPSPSPPAKPTTATTTTMNVKKPAPAETPSSSNSSRPSKPPAPNKPTVPVPNMTATAKSMSSIFASMIPDSPPRPSLPGYKTANGTPTISPEKGSSSSSSSAAKGPPGSFSFGGGIPKKTAPAPNEKETKAKEDKGKGKASTSTGTFGLGRGFSNSPVEDITEEEDEEQEPHSPNGPFPNEPEIDDLNGQGRYPQRGPNDPEFDADFEAGLNEDGTPVDPEAYEANQELRYWQHLRGLNASFLLELIKAHTEDCFTDLSGIFRSYKIYRRSIIGEMVEWLRANGKGEGTESAGEDESESEGEDEEMYYDNDEEEDLEPSQDHEMAENLPNDPTSIAERQFRAQQELERLQPVDRDKTPPAGPQLPRAPVGGLYIFGGVPVSSFAGATTAGGGFTPTGAAAQFKPPPPAPYTFERPGQERPKTPSSSATSTGFTPAKARPSSAKRTTPQPTATPAPSEPPKRTSMSPGFTFSPSNRPAATAASATSSTTPPRPPAATPTSAEPPKLASTSSGFAFPPSNRPAAAATSTSSSTTPPGPPTAATNSTEPPNPASTSPKFAFPALNRPAAAVTSFTSSTTTPGPDSTTSTKGGFGFSLPSKPLASGTGSTTGFAFGLTTAPVTTGFSFGTSAVKPLSPEASKTAESPVKSPTATTTTTTSTFPGFGPITGGPSGSPFGTKPAGADTPTGSSTVTGAFGGNAGGSVGFRGFGSGHGDRAAGPTIPGSNDTTQPGPFGTADNPAIQPFTFGLKPSSIWPASTSMPEPSKPGSLFGTPPSGSGAAPIFESHTATGISPFGSSGSIFGAKAPLSGTEPPAFGSMSVFGGGSSSSAFGGGGTASSSLDPPKKAEGPPSSGTKANDDDTTPKAKPAVLPSVAVPPPALTRVGNANPWATSSSTSSLAPTAGGPFKFGMGSKPAAVDTDSSPERSSTKSSGFSFADPPLSFKLPSAGAFSFAEPPKASANAATAFNPFASPPKTGTLFGFGAKAGGLGSSTFGSGSSAPSIPSFGVGSSGAFSFGAPSMLPKGPFLTSSASGSSQETNAAPPSGSNVPVGEFAPGDSGAAGSSSAGAGTSQDSDVAPESGTGLALGEDKFDQPGPGEEMEESLFNVRGKVMKFSDGVWVDMGIGQIRLYKHKETGSRRVFARNSKSGRILLNFAPFAKMEPKIDEQKPKFMRMTAMDDGKLIKILIKMKEESEAAQLVNVLQKEVEALS